MKYLLLILLLAINSLELFSLNKDSLLQVVKTTRNDSIKVSMLNDLAFAEIHNNADEALSYLAASEQIARAKNLPYGLTRMLCIKAIVYDIAGQRDSARHYFNESLQLSQEFEYKNLEVRALNGLGMNSWNTGKFDQALKYFFSALKLNDELKPPLQLSPSIFYNNIGLIYQEMKLYDKALIYHQQAYQIRLDNNMLKDMATSLNNIGICYKNTGKLDTAVTTFKEGIKVSEISGNKFEYYKLISNLANVYILQKKYREAIEMLHKVIENSMEVANNPRSLLILYGNISTAYSGDNQPEKSYYYAKEGLKILENNPGLGSFSADIYQMLIRNSYILGYHDDGDKYLTDNKRILDEKFSKESASAIAEMEIKYESLNKEKQLHEMKVNAQKRETLYISLAVFAFLIGIIGLLLYGQQQIKRKQQEREFVLKHEIAEIETQNMLQNQRISISRDLHDNIGSHLSFIISSINNLIYKYKTENMVLYNHLKKIESFAAETIIELRDTIWAMDMEKFQFEDLKTRLIGFINKQRTANPEIKIELEADEKLYEPSMNPFAGITIYRIIQEAANNTLKHSMATLFRISITMKKDTLYIELCDNGVGFDMENCSHGHGLYNMEKRCKELNGEISIQSSPGKGTTINMKFTTDNLKLV
jgi:signal transduction histidine kinase/Tfp pilus assembly protein PilF